MGKPPPEKAAPGGTRILGETPVTRALAKGPVGPELPEVQRLKELLAVVAREHYEEGEEYARGGLGRIIKSVDRRLHRVVALKELHFKHAAAEARFVREAYITARLQHPGIVAVYEAGRWESGELFYAMKFVDGKPLSVVIAHRDGLEERLGLVRVVTDVAKALAYAHTQRIIHRDLKPANILVGAFGETVVIDWGLAKDLDNPALELEPDVGPPDPKADEDKKAYETTVGSVMGTPAYMPPEQAQGLDLDEAADVYALGAVLYHLVAGHRPYADLDTTNVVEALLEGPPTSLASIEPDVPRDLLAIVEKAMARDPEGRYPSAREMATELANFGSGRLVGAYQYSLWELLKRFVRRQMAAVTTALLAGVALVVFGAISFVQVTDERDRASQAAYAEANARREAERRIDELVVANARSLVRRDPTAAAAWLKALRTPVRGAATVLAAAEQEGVARRVLRAHQDVVVATAVSPDGKYVASASADKSIRLWELETGLSRVLGTHLDRVTAIEFSADGQSVASGSYDGTAHIWPITSGLTSQVIQGHRGAVKAVAFSPEGDRLATVGEEGTVRVWRMDGTLALSFTAPVDRDAFVAFGPMKGQLTTGVHDERVYVWDLEAGVGRVFGDDTEGVRSVAVSPVSQRVALGDVSGAVREYGPDRQLIRMHTGHEGAVRALRYNASGTRLVSGGQGGAVWFWPTDAEEPELLGRHQERVSALEFGPAGDLIASASWDRTVHLFEPQLGVEAELRGHGDVVSALSFTPDGSQLISGSWDKSLRVWPVDARLQAEGRVLKGHTVGVHSVAVSPDGRYLASGGHDNSVRLWDIQTGESQVWEGHTDHVFRVVFSPDGQRVASSSDDQTVRLWTLEGEGTVLRGHGADVEELAFLSNDRLVSGSEDSTARIWNIEDGTAVVLQGHRAHVSGVDVSADRKLVVTGSRDGSVRLWSSDGKLIREMAGHRDEVRGVAFSPDGKSVASASADDSVRIWDVESGDSMVLGAGILRAARVVQFSPDGTLLAVTGLAPSWWLCSVRTADCEEMRGHRALVRDVAFSPDGGTVVSAGGDALVQIWDTETAEHRELTGHGAAVFDVTLSPNGATIVSGSGDGTIRLWSLLSVPAPMKLNELLEGLTHEPKPEVDAPPIPGELGQ